MRREKPRTELLKIRYLGYQVQSEKKFWEDSRPGDYIYENTGS